MTRRDNTHTDDLDTALLNFGDVEFRSEAVLAAQVPVWTVYSEVFGRLRKLQLASGVDRISVGMYCTFEIMPVSYDLIDHGWVEMYTLLALLDSLIVG